MAETASLYLNDDAPLRFDAEVVRRAAGCGLLLVSRYGH